MDLRQIIAKELDFLKESELQELLLQHARVADIPAGTAILQDGTYVKQVPILLDGLVKVVKEENEKELLLYYIYPLESCIVSIHCGINDLKSTVKAVTEEDCQILLLPSLMIRAWQQRYPSFNDFLMQLYHKRFNDVLNAFNALAFQSIDERLLAYLEAKVKALNSQKIEMTHQELGDELGTARETASRILKKLETEGKVKLHRGWIEVGP